MEYADNRDRGANVVNSFKAAAIGEERLRILEAVGIDDIVLRLGIDADAWPRWHDIAEKQLQREEAAGKTTYHREIRDMLRRAAENPITRNFVTYKKEDGTYETRIRGRG